MIIFSSHQLSASRKQLVFILLSILMAMEPLVVAGSAVNKQDLTASLEAFNETGLGGVEITPIYRTRGEEDRFIEDLSPEWMEMLTHTLKEARREVLMVMH